jgi:hypothetical protein
MREKVIFYQQIAEPVFVPSAPAIPVITQWMPHYPILPPKRPNPPLLPHQMEFTSGAQPVLIIALTGNELLAPVELRETWSDHFASRGWNTVQDQIDAGFPYFIQPVPEKGSYVETIDYGTVLNNVIVNIDWTTIPIAGTVTVTCKVESSLDGLTWTPPVTGTSMFLPTFRFLRLTISFQGAS